ncbi:MAG: proton-conducting transporter membrane subunit [Phototrophicales bacterium]|nr:proton-conducting transporter membrane subunit [Phototrophicales bacterium]
MPNNPIVLGPVFIPLFFAVITLGISRFSTHNNQLQRYVALIGSSIGSFFAIVILLQNWEIARANDGGVAVQIYRMGGWQPPYGIVLTADLLSSIFAAMSSLVVTAGILYALKCKDKCVTYPVFMPLFLCMGGSLIGCFYTGDIFTLFVFLELMVLSSVVLVAISDNKLGLEAAIKYLMISATGTLFLLIGIAAIYATFSTLNFADIARLLQTGERPILAQAAAVMFVAVFLVKSAVFPFHFWQPDFHTTAPTPVHSVLSSVVVKVGVYGLLRVVTLLFTEEAVLINQILMLLGIIGIFFGSLGALRTYDAKRMLAYSTFGQIGFILVGIGWGNPLALIGAIVYSVNHAFIKSALLMLVGVVSSRNVMKTAKMKYIAGVGKPFALVGILYFIGGMALAGVPPLNGFISKLALIRGGIFAQSWLTLGLAVAAGMITLLYMTRTYVLMFQQAPTVESAELKEKGKGDSVLAPFLLISICVLLGIFATPLVELVGLAVAQMSDPFIYITAVLGA